MDLGGLGVFEIFGLHGSRCGFPDSSGFSGFAAIGDTSACLMNSSTVFGFLIITIVEPSS